MVLGGEFESNECAFLNEEEGWYSIHKPLADIQYRHQ